MWTQLLLQQKKRWWFQAHRHKAALAEIAMNTIVQQSNVILKAAAGEGLTGNAASWLDSGRDASAALEACAFQKLFLIF